LFEQIWRALWPPVGVLGALAVFALLDGAGYLPIFAHWGALAIGSTVILVLLARGLSRLRWPDAAATDRRLEGESGLPRHTLASLTDRPARSDPLGQALWQAHLARALKRIQNLRAGPPRPGLARVDRKALRGAVIVALVAAVVVAGRDAPSRLLAASWPSVAPLIRVQPTVELKAWIAPPAYTKLPPLFLKPADSGAEAPAGSRLTVIVTGATARPDLVLASAVEPLIPTDRTSFQLERDLTATGAFGVVLDGRTLASWDITVLPDRPPTVAWGGTPGPGPADTALRLPWRAEDDYGLITVRAELRLLARPAADPIVLAVPLPAGAPKTGHGVSRQDLIAHPWAGLPVTAQLFATDQPGQAGASESVTVTLPERAFQNPIARMLVEMRKQLSLNPDDRTEALAGLDQLLIRPTMFGDDSQAWVNVSALYSLLARNKTQAAVPEAQDRMWQLALHLEDGQVDRTARSLEQARRDAREALDRATRDPSDANRRDLDQKLRELREAIDRHMQAMMEQAKRDGTVMELDPEAHSTTNHDLDRLAERAREAARQGRMEEAERRVKELEELLDQLKNGRVARSERGDQQQNGSQQRRQRGQQQMGAVQDMIGRQGGLLDQSESRNEATNRPRGVPPPSAPADAQARREADRRVQNALRRSLGELMQQFGDLTGEIPQALSEADQAMRDAASELARGQDQSAGAAQQRAIEALQQGAQQMGQAMARQFGPGQPGSQEGEGEQGEGQPGEGGRQFGMSPGDRRGEGRSRGPIPGDPGRADPRGRDPLGRYNQGTAADSADVTVPGEAEHLRGQALREELRRRGGERERPMPELDYIDRLLKRF
jgi:uncharacterized protein (TIGR02302 family)